MNDLSLDRRSGRALLPLLALAALLMVGCTPGGPDSESDLGMVVTSSIPGADYAGLLTFAMADSVLILDVDDSTAEPIDPTYNEVIIEELRAQMVAAGFQDVSPDTATVTPDVWLVCGAVQSEVWYYSYDYGYGYWWGYYPPPATVQNFTQGTVLWQLMDMREVQGGGGDDTIALIWLAGINGALQKSESTTESGIRTGIRQAFTQSSYIQASPAGK